MTGHVHFVLQSAYKKHHSTESALLKVKNDILMNMDGEKGNPSDPIGSSRSV